MGGMFGGGGTISVSEPRIGALRIQTSAFGMAMSLAYGKPRIQANLIWSGDWTPIAHTSSSGGGGKGGGGPTMESTTYTYKTGVAMGLGEGEFGGVESVWRGKDYYTAKIVPAEVITVQGELHVVPAGLQVTVANAEEFHATLAVAWQTTDSEGAVYFWPMTDVSPAMPTSAGQFSCAGGTYTFHSGALGHLVRIGYEYIIPEHPLSALAQLGLEFFSGAMPQEPWGYLVTKHPAEAIGYSGLAYVAAGAYDLGASASLDNHNFEVRGLLPFSSAIHDSNPRDVLVDFLTNSRYGAGFPAEKIGDLAAWSNWCVANGLFVSPVYSEQRAAHECMTDLIEATGAEPVYSEGKLKIVPYGDVEVSGNGATYVPDLRPQYDLTDDDFLAEEGEDPIRVIRRSPADAYNAVKVEISNRANQYNLQPVEATDQADIDAFGLRPEDPRPYHFFTTVEAGQLAAQLRLQRKLYVRNEYEGRLGWRFARLEPMDIVTLTDSGLGLYRWPVRITEVEEDEDGELSVRAEEMPVGSATPAVYGSQAAAGYGTAHNAAPGPVAAPLIFEPPLALTAGQNEIWMAVAGQSGEWGGCSVWASLDGTGYKRIGTIYGAARYGVLHDALDAPAEDPDTIHSAVVDLVSDGQLLAGSQADVDQAATLCWVGGELFAYRDASLTAYRRYALGYLRRGLYGSQAGAHSAGAGVARIDEAIFRYSLPAESVGKPIWIKLTSFNSYGKAEQGLGDVSAWSYTPQGGKPAGPSNLALQAPWVGTEFTAQWAAAVGGSGYKAEIWAQGVKRRSVDTTATVLTYRLEDAIADGGPWREISVKVATVANGQTSGYSQINVSNPVPAAPTGISTSATDTSITVSWSAAGDVDLQDYQVWLSASSGFTPGEASLKYTGTALEATVGGLDPETTYYLRVAARDKWGAGDLTYSAQISQTTQAAPGP